MYNREILPGEQGVTYQYENTTILWAFENFQYQKEGIKSITDVLNNNLVNLNQKGSFNASKLTVYQIKLA